MRLQIRSARSMAVATVLAGGFALAGCGGEGPDGVAERFWEAGRDQDLATLEALSVPSDDIDFSFAEQDDAGISTIEVGDASIDGDEAEVETRLVVEGEDMDLDLEFVTIMAKRDGQWLVDMDETTDELMKAAIGASMQEIGEAIGEGMQEAMEGLAEGLAEGMEGLAESLEGAAAEMERDRR